MKRIGVLLIVSLYLVSCRKDDISVDDLIYALHIETKTVLADGTKKIKVTAIVNPKADVSKRSVVFQASTGEFADGKDGKITKVAAVEGDSLVATAQYIVPSSPGRIIIKAKLDLPEEKKEYWREDSIEAVESTPAKIELDPSAFGVVINYGSEITLTGKLTNKDGSPVSKGFSVTMSDRYDGGGPVNGRFRAESLKTGTGGTVSSVYSPGFVQVNKKIWLHAVVDNILVEGKPVEDSVLIETIPE